MTSGETNTIYQELVSFLSSSRSDIRKAAAEATLAALSTSDDNENDTAAKQLTSLNAILPLCKIASQSSSNEDNVDDGSSIDALSSLLILCSHDLVGNQCILDFIESKGIGRMIEIALSNPPTPPSTASSIAALDNNNTDSSSNNSKLAKQWNEWRKQVNYACALLANATRNEVGAVEFIGYSFPKEAVPSSSQEEKVDTSASSTDSTKPTAVLLLSRFLNPLFINVTSDAYKLALEAWESIDNNGTKKKKNVEDGKLDDDEYDSDDLDLDALEDDDDEPPNDESLTKAKEEQQSASIAKDMNSENEYYDPYQHIAAVIMNITQLDNGRKFLMKLIHHNEKEDKKDGKTSTKEPTTGSHLQSILPQLNSPNITRRQGIAGTLKNCCFAQDSIWWLLNVIHLDKHLLMTLAGPEELTIDEKVGLDPDYWLLGPLKKRESNVLVRLYVVEALLILLASGRRSRETLRERRTYVIIKLADMVEENEEVSERMLECVQYLRRDEYGEEEGSSDQRAYEKYAKGMLEMDGVMNKKTQLKALPPSTTAAGNSANEDEEDYDKID